MTYDAKVELHYTTPQGTTNFSTRLVPAPQLSISTEYLYANDTIIGYTYNVTINGYATSLDRRTNSQSDDLDFSDVMKAVKRVRDTFDHNGGSLIVLDAGEEVLRADGAIVQSIEFQESDNYWVNYAKYSVVLSCQSLSIGDCSSAVELTCSDLPDDVKTKNSPIAMDMIKYKVKSVSENLDINLDNSLLTWHKQGMYSEYITLSYNVEAVGRHYVDNNILMPAWQQAKNFCEYRLRLQAQRIQSRTIGPLATSASADPCNGGVSHSSFDGEESVSLLHKLLSQDYGVYNEKVECSASESDGSFSLSYNSILKRHNSDESIFKNNCIHKITRNRDYDISGPQKVIKETVQGEIQGLIEGGLIHNPDLWELPDDGTLFVATQNGTQTAYNAALEGYNQLVESDGKKGKKLKGRLVAEKLKITKFQLGGTGSSAPNKKSHTVAHNYNAGTVSYTEEYDNININSTGNNTVTNIVINIDDALPVVAEFVVPGREKGPIYQKMIAVQPRRITVSIDGSMNIAENEGVQSAFDTEHFQNMYCTGMALPPGVPPTGLTGYEITENTFNMNYGDRTYTINRAYVKLGADI